VIVSSFVRNIKDIFKPPRRDVVEYLDAPLVGDESISIDELDRNMRQMRFLDEAFGGLRMLLSGVAELRGKDNRISVLDVGTGAAAVPLALVRIAESRGIEADVVGIDLGSKALAVATRGVAGRPIQLVLGDGRALPFADNAFDVAVTTLTMHHCSPEDAIRLLKEMDRVSRKGFVAVDLIRSRMLWALLWALTRLQPRNRLTHHDGPVSALRAYSLAEARQIIRQAGLDADVRHQLFRMSIVHRKSG
jgi:ubiquinone/menaquinone biosynthesis C-methylase UbiE